MADVNTFSEEYLTAKEAVLSNQPFEINNFQYLIEKKNNFFRDNPDFSQNKILMNFLSDDYNLCIFIVALFGEKELQKLLNERFKEFYFEYRFIAYVSKLLYFKAVNFDRKERKQMGIEPIILDMLVDKEHNLRLSDLIFIGESDFDYSPTKFDDLIVDENLYAAYKKLTTIQQEILYLAYHSLLKDTEIAKKLNITQQAVSKNRKQALNILRKSLRREGDE